MTDSVRRFGKKVLLWGVVAVAVFFSIGLVAKWNAERKTPEAVARIHARKVTMEMVEGKNLPPKPDERENNRTVAGVDANTNGIRDDVELAIHERHPDSPKIRAAQLQYAMALQAQLTEVFSKGTLIAAIQEGDRGWGCIKDIFPLRRDGLPTDRPTYEWTQKEMDLSNQYFKEKNKKDDPLVQEVKNLVVNNDFRRRVFEESYKYMTTYGGLGGKEDCDLDLESLGN